MSKTNEIAQLIDSIITCGQNMEKLGHLLKEMIPKEKVPEETADPPETTYSFMDVRKAFAAKSHAGYTAKIRELIKKHGADRLSDIKEEDYPVQMAELEALE